MTWQEQEAERFWQHLQENWTAEGRKRTLEMQMSEPTFDVIKGADGINRPFPKEASDIYHKYFGLDLGRLQNTKEICGND